MVLFTKRRAADAVGRPEGHVGGPLALMSSRSGTKLATLASESRELSTDAADALRNAPRAWVAWVAGLCRKETAGGFYSVL